MKIERIIEDDLTKFEPIVIQITLESKADVEDMNNMLAFPLKTNVSIGSNSRKIALMIHRKVNGA